MYDLASFDFDDAPLRVVLIAGEPWFVANDVAKVLGYRNAPDMTRNLDDDEAATHNLRSSGQMRELTIISESGLYAAILKSRRTEARRFRRWVTSEVLPAIRRTGGYQLHQLAGPFDLDPARLAVGVSVVREARRLFGPIAARGLWHKVGLPACIADSEAVFEGDPFATPLKAWLADKVECTIQQAAEGLGVEDPSKSERYRIGQLLRLWGWSPHKRKVAKHRTATVFSRPQDTASEGVDE